MLEDDGTNNDQGGNVTDLDAEKKKRNNAELLADLRTAAEKLSKEDDDIAVHHANKKKIRQEFIKKHDIKMGAFNVMYALYRLDDEADEKIAETLEHLVLSAEALGMQLPLFPPAELGGDKSGGEGDDA